MRVPIHTLSAFLLSCWLLALFCGQLVSAAYLRDSTPCADQCDQDVAAGKYSPNKVCNGNYEYPNACVATQCAGLSSSQVRRQLSLKTNGILNFIQTLN